MRIQAAVSRPGTPAPSIESVELEEPRAGEILVRNVATGICHTDLHAHAGLLSPLPIVLGHEGAGVVEAVGPGVTALKAGDHVVMSGSSCGACPNCAESLPSYCDQAMPRNFGGGRLDGSTALSAGGEAIHSHFFGQSSFATHSVIPWNTAVKVDPDLELDRLGPLACGVITGAGGVLRALKVAPGSSIAVFGAGGVGMSAIMAARLAGAERIIAVDLAPDRLELALELGATDAIDGREGEVPKRIRDVAPRGVDYAFNTVNAPAVFDDAMASLAVRGVCGFVAAPRQPWSPPMFPMLAGGRTVRGILGGDAAPRQFIPMLIEYWRQGRLPFDRMIRFYDFADLPAAFKDAGEGRTIKPVLRMPA